MGDIINACLDEWPPAGIIAQEEGFVSTGTLSEATGMS